MPSVQAMIVHDIMGQIISVNRPSKNADIVVLPQEGQSVFIAHVDEKTMETLLDTHSVDIGKKTLVARANGKTGAYAA